MRYMCQVRVGQLKGTRICSLRWVQKDYVPGFVSFVTGFARRRKTVFFEVTAASGIPRNFFREGGGWLRQEFFTGVVNKFSLGQGAERTGIWGRHIQEFFSGGGGWSRQEFLQGYTKCGWGREQRDRGSGGDSPLVRGSTQFADEWNPYSD
jgi:hypothetical protein